jgi:LytS/YehU family sensor histidine kinase
MNQESIYALVIAILSILLAYLLDRIQKLNYLLQGRLSGSHNLQNLLVSGMYIQNPDSKNNFLKAVTELIQYSFRSQNTVFVPVEEEIKQVNHLILIHNIRNQSLIRLDIQYLESSENSYRIPPFMLITLIENALIYGKLNKNARILLMINTQKEEMYKIELGGYELPEAGNISRPTPGHGIDFVKQRLSYLHDIAPTSLSNPKQLYINRQNKTLCLIIPILKSY